MSILIFNGSPSGHNGNSASLIRKIQPQLKNVKAETVHLNQQKWSAAARKKLFKEIEAAEGFIFVTGTYWDSWGSPLQTFLENITELEGTGALMGKPAMVVVLNHSVGGKGVLSRLQGVLSTMGCLIPPMCGMVYAWSTQELLKSKVRTPTSPDLWTLDDLVTMTRNFLLASRNRIPWEAWPVDARDFRRPWLKT